MLEPHDIETIGNHYKFHKGTTYSIGHLKDRSNSLSVTKNDFVAKERMDKKENPIQGGDHLPGRRNQAQMGIHNQNKVPNYAIGDNTPCVRGTPVVDKLCVRLVLLYFLRGMVGKVRDQFRKILPGILS